MARPPYIRRKPTNPFNAAALGVYRGPERTIEAPKLTPYRVTLLRAIVGKEVQAGKGQYVGAFRWHHAGTSVTCTKWVREFVGCGWAKVVGAHLELTDAGAAVLESAGEESPCGKRRFATRDAADKALLNGAHGLHSYKCRAKGCGGWHTTSQPLVSLPGGRSALTDAEGEA
jgi:hypothetical protein